MTSDIAIFVAPYPEQKIKDGYLQRVEQIDHIFKQVHGLYIQNSEHYEHFGYKPISDIRSVIFTNPSFIQSSNFINLLCADINTHFFLYIHSIYQYPLALALLKKIPRHQRTVILDVHGAVPEEELFLGNKANFEKYSLMESAAVREADYLVCVTQAMYKHLTQKYNFKIGKEIILPMASSAPDPFDDDKPTTHPEVCTKQTLQNLLPSKLQSYETVKKIIYAGGLQKWQKIDSFVHLIRTLTNFQTTAYTSKFENSNVSISFSLWTHNTQEFLEPYGQLPNLEINSGSSREVKLQLLNSHFSFVGRDPHILNTVSCPTKLIECLINHCIPILMYDEIGDFKNLGLQYVQYKDLLNNQFPTTANYKEMLQKNELVLIQLKEMQKSGESKLVNVVQTQLKSSFNDKVSDNLKSPSAAGSKTVTIVLQNYDFTKDVNIFVRHQFQCFFHFSIKVFYRCLRFILFRLRRLREKYKYPE